MTTVGINILFHSSKIYVSSYLKIVQYEVRKVLYGNLYCNKGKKYERSET